MGKEIKDYVSESKRIDELMGIYRQLKRLAELLKALDVRAWKNADITAAKVLRYARKEGKTLKSKRVRK